VSLLNKVFARQPSKGDFARLAMRAFEQAGVAGLEYEEAEFTLKRPGQNVTIFLHNSYANYCSVRRSERHKVIAELVAGLGVLPEVPQHFARAKHHVMPVVQSATAHGLTKLMASKQREDPGLETEFNVFAGELLVGLAYDTEHSITTVNGNSLIEWGVTLEEALAVARENLWDRTDPNRFAGRGGVYWGEWHDSYDSSRILLTEFIYRLSVDGDPVAFVPNRDAIWVTGTKNTEGLRAVLKAGAESHFRQGHPISPDLYVLQDGIWNMYLPEESESLEIWTSMRRRRDGLDYAQQKELLDQLYESEETDVFVANFTIFTREDGSNFSACVWPKDVDSSLPQAEVIGLVVDDESRDSFMVPWDKAASVVGDLLEEEPGLTPVRYRARQFPSDAQIAQLRQLAF